MITQTVFFIQYQGDAADFSDGTADPQVISTLDEAVTAFKQASHHRRLLALSVDRFTQKPQGMAVELSRV